MSYRPSLTVDEAKIQALDKLSELLDALVVIAKMIPPAVAELQEELHTQAEKRRTRG